jgi:hypothetical protein
MKTLKDIKQDMSNLYEEVRAGSCDLKTSAELSNIAGKFLKADQLELAREVFLSGQYRQNQIAHKPEQQAELMN